MRDCDICGGSRTIRLPVLRRVSARPQAAVVAIQSEKSYRDYPCPECGTMVEASRVAVLETITQFESRDYGTEFMADVERKAAHHLVELLLKDDFIAVEIGKEDSRQLTRPVKVTMGVVSKRHVATMEKRIAERQADIANEVAHEAKRQIDVWGRDFGHDKIFKAQAKDSVNDALKQVLARRAGTV